MNRNVRTLVPIILLTLVLAGTSCTLNEHSVSSESTFTILHPWDERIAGPYYDVMAKFLVFLPLLTHDENGHLQGKLAKSWDVSEDYREWTFHLHQNVKWHDGIPVTAHDIKFTLELISHHDVLFDDAWLGMQNITIHDDFTLTVDFESPKYFADTWLVFWPSHILEKQDPRKFWEWDFWVHPIGNGPYIYVRHIPQTLMEFQSNPDYYLGEPKIKRIILKFGSASPLLELQAGHVDALTYFSQDDFPKLARHPQFQAYHEYSPDFAWLTAIYWNLKDPLFNDPKVRRALTMAIDRKNLLSVLYLPMDLKQFDTVFTGHHYRHDEIPPALPYDPETASHLLEEAGWEDRSNNGRLEKGGQVFRFTAILPPSSEGFGSYENAAVFIQSQLREIGVQMEIQSMDPILVQQRLRSGQFQASFFRFFQSPNALVQWFGDDSPLGYDNLQLTSMLEVLKRTAIPEETNRIYGKIMPLFSDDIPLTFLYPQLQTYIVHKRIKGLISPYRVDPVRWAEHLWIEEVRE